jgi:phenylalanyl-tRNA synthetase beta chain
MAVAVSSKHLGLRSEASARFERGTDPDVVDLAARRLAELLAPCGARLVEGSVTVDGDLPERRPVVVRPSRVERLLGTRIGADRIVALLEPLGFDVSPRAGQDGDEVLEVRVPSFRPDTATETDVIEEIARHHGYSRIPRRVPRAVQTGSLTELQRDRRTIRQVLVGLGVHEAMPLPFLAPGDLDRAGLPAEAVVLTNPLAAEESVLRTSLRPGLLRAIAYNESHRTDGAALFEVGKVFRPPLPGATLPDEREHLGVVLAGRDALAAVQVWEVLHRTLALPDPGIDQTQAVDGLHPGRAGVVTLGGRPVGEVGEIDPGVLAALGIRERVAWLQVDLGSALSLGHGSQPYRAISRYPSSDVDLAFEVAETVPASHVAAAIRGAAGELLVDLQLFDVFRGPPVPDGRRSLAYRLRLQAGDHTLTDDEITAVREAVVARLEADHRATLRA